MMSRDWKPVSIIRSFVSCSKKIIVTLLKHSYKQDNEGFGTKYNHTTETNVAVVGSSSAVTQLQPDCIWDILENGY